MKTMEWKEYLNTQQDFYLDEENNAGNELVYETDEWQVWAHMSLHADNKHYFSGKDDDFAMVSNKADYEYLCYECTLEDIIKYLNEDQIINVKNLGTMKYLFDIDGITYEIELSKGETKQMEYKKGKFAKVSLDQISQQPTKTSIGSAFLRVEFDNGNIWRSKDAVIPRIITPQEKERKEL